MDKTCEFGPSGRLSWPSVILACFVLAVFGAAYRVIASRLRIAEETAIKLPVPLRSMPNRIGRWNGKDVPIAETVLDAAGNDDFINRLYVNANTDQWANLYVGYSGRPRTMIGHRPDVCYQAGGWIYDYRRKADLLSKSGRKFPCLVHRFHRPEPDARQIFVLNFYVLNGRITSDEQVFTGLGWRTPNIDGNPARYVAQVQISSSLESSVRAFAGEAADVLMEFLPDENGIVKASTNIKRTR